jgi:hypothetical protein
LGRATHSGASAIAAAAEEIGGPSVPQPSGGDSGTPFEALATGSVKQSAGLPGPAVNQPLGAASGAENLSGQPGASGASAAVERAASTAGTSESLSGSATSGNLARATNANDSSQTGPAALPDLPAAATTAAPAVGQELSAGFTAGTMALSQHGNGRWSLQTFPNATAADIGQIQSDTAATGLALLAFLGAGYDHYGDEYQLNVARGLEFLVQNQKPNGDLYLAQDQESNKSAWLYSHGIATIALCEAYGMTRDEKLREPAQKALDFIIASQDKQLGGWRYVPGQESDTSVTGWQLMALKSGELANLKVDPQAYAGVRKWLDSARARTETGAALVAQYVYNPQSDLRTNPNGRRPNPAATSMGLLMRMYLGEPRDSPEMRQGALYLLANPPEYGTAASGKRNTYYWYYASQVLYHVKGEAWTRWNEQLRALLVQSQVKTGPQAGSWDPNGAVPDRWGRFGGRLYITVLNLLSLEVKHRHLPIYESISEQTAGN